jgi:peptidyl-prolyl cis-trans isomerase B (cyclophilin B)
LSSDPNRQRPRSSKKRRAVQTGSTGTGGTGRPPTGGAPNRPTAQRVRAGSTRGGRAAPAKGGIPGGWLAIGAIAVFAVGVLLASGSLKFGGGGSPSGSSAPSSGIAGSVSVVPPAGGSPGASTAARGTNCPTSQPPPAPAGQTRVVTIETAKGQFAITLKADLSPIAVGNFAALAACGYYNGIVFHRVATLQDGTPFVIQGGDPTGTGSGGPGYEIQDEPVTAPYVRGTVAMARTQAPNSVGSQFFIVLDDKDQAVLKSANTYQIIGSVTAGMETVDAIYAAAGGQEQPANPIAMTKVTIGDPVAAGSASPGASVPATAAPSPSTP